MRTRQNRAEPFERAVKYVLFDQTCRYGMDPFRCLGWLVCFFFSFAFLYLLAQCPSWRSGAIWADWPKSFERLSNGFPASEFSDTRLSKPWWKLWLSSFGLAAYFSALSALRIGWHQVNFGEWLERIQPRDYHLRATGWVKSASGVQSLISVLLLALFLLTYFGNPFG